MNSRWILTIFLLCVLSSTVQATTVMVNSSGAGDGWLQRDDVSDETWAALINGAGNGVDTTAATARYRIVTPATENMFAYLYRPYWQFPTNTIPDGATIISAKVYLYGTAYVNQLADTPSVALYSFTPATNGTAVDADYSQGGTTPLSNSIVGTSLTTTGYNEFNITDLSYVSKTAWTNFMLKTNWDATNTSPTWAGSKVVSIYFASEEATGASTDPYMVIEYVVAPTADFSVDTASGYTPLTVSFTDASVESPSSWAWYYRNTDGGADTLFSTDQNPSNVFADVGTYDIKLNASNAAGISWHNHTGGYITVLAVVPPSVAGFSSNVTIGKIPNMAAQLTDSSTNAPTNWDWYWFDNETKSSDVQNPVATFNTTGTYSIRLYASNVFGGSWSNETDYIWVVSAGSHVLRPKALTAVPTMNRAQENSDDLMDAVGIGAYGSASTDESTTPDPIAVEGVLIGLYDSSIGAMAVWIIIFGVFFMTLFIVTNKPIVVVISALALSAVIAMFMPQQMITIAEIAIAVVITGLAYLTWRKTR